MEKRSPLHLGVVAIKIETLGHPRLGLPTLLTCVDVLVNRVLIPATGR